MHQPVLAVARYEDKAAGQQITREAIPWGHGYHVEASFAAEVLAFD